MTQSSRLAPLKIILVEASDSGRTTFINTLFGQTDPTSAMNFGRMTVNERFLVYVFGMPEVLRLHFIDDALREGMLGFIMMIDSRQPEISDDTSSLIRTLRAYAPTPYVIAANFQDHPDACSLEDLRLALHIDPEILIAPCIVTDRASVKSVLVALLDEMLEDIDEAGPYGR